MTKAPRYGDTTLYRRLFQEARPYWFHLTGLFFLSLLAAPLALLLPLPVKIVVDNVLGGEALPGAIALLLPEAWHATPAALLVTAAAAIVVFAILVQLQDLAAWVLKTWIGEKLVLGLRSKLFEHLQRLSLGFHSEKGTADSIYRLQFDAPAIQSVAIQGAIPFATALVKVVVLLYVTWRIDATVALIAILGGPVLFGLTELYRGRLRRRWAEARAEESSAMGVVQESLAAVRVVKAFGQEARESGRYLHHARASLGATLRAVLAHGTFDLLVGITTGIGAAVILYVGARHVQEGQISLGDLLLVMAYLSQLFQPLRELGTRVADMQKALASAERVLTILDEE
ncbi:MAG: ABC transporter transmembrane domain-containing protein, partial [Planctomycetota bacterium]